MALAFEQREYSLLELDALANGMATVLEHRGVRAGERVALMSSNRPEFVDRPVRDLAAGCVGGAAQPGVEADRGRECAGVDQAVTRGRRPSGARRGDADAAAGRGDHAGTRGRSKRRARKAMRCSCSAPARPACPRRCVTPTRRSPSRCGTGVTRCDLSSADRMQIMTPPSHILGLLNIVMALETGAWIRLHRRFDID